MLDEILFKQQSFGFGFGRQKHHGCGQRNHSFDSSSHGHGIEIVSYPVFEVLGFSNIQNLALGTQHSVNAGAPIKRFGIMPDTIDPSQANLMIGFTSHCLDPKVLFSLSYVKSIAKQY